MDAKDILNDGVKLVKANAPELLTGFGVTGVLSTVYFTAKGTFRAAEIIWEDDVNRQRSVADRELFIHRAKLIWRCYIPAGISGGLTIACVVGSSKASNRRTAAAVTAYSLSERAFAEYREKVIEQVGKGKERSVRDAIAQDKVDKTPPGKDIIIAGSGTVLCCELMTGRYFMSDMETLRKAQNDINAKIVNELYVMLDEFYDIVGIPHTSKSDLIGWDSNKLMELQFSTVLSSTGVPCLAFDYNYTKFV